MPVHIETMMKECVEELSSHSVRAILKSAETTDSSAVWSMALSAQCKEITKSESQPLSLEEICHSQREDQNISPVVECLK